MCDHHCSERSRARVEGEGQCLSSVAAVVTGAPCVRQSGSSSSSARVSSTLPDRMWAPKHRIEQGLSLG